MTAPLTSDEKAELRKVAETAGSLAHTCGNSAGCLGCFACADEDGDIALGQLRAARAATIALLDENARLAAEVERLKAEIWTKCSERMPSNGALIALLTWDGRVLGYRVGDDGKFYREGFSPYPLHESDVLASSWMPLPEPPR